MASSTFDSLFDRTFIINLDTRQDRWNDILPELERMGIENYERFSAICPKLEDLDPRFYSGMTAQYSKNPDGYRIGASGCKLSHMKILETALERGYENCLILEDDAYFTADGFDVFQAAASELPEINWDMLYFSGSHKRPTTPVTDHIKRIQFTYTTHAYAIKRHLMQSVFNDLKTYSKEVDVYYAQKIHRQGKSYCIEPHIIRQRPGFSDILSKTVQYGV